VRFGIDLPIFGPYSDVRLLAELALEAEQSGWDGCFLWDHIQMARGEPLADPWVALAVMAYVTSRIRLGTLVMPIFRRHLAKLARETVTLDHLSRGRLILGVGLGDDRFGEISAFGGPQDDRVRAEVLDEGLAVLTGLWSGRPCSFAGKHLHVKDAYFTPASFQSPRIPIWVAGTWPKKPPFRRAARYEGIVPVVGDMATPLSPAQTRDIVDYIGRFRTQGVPFDVIHFGLTRGVSADEDREVVGSYTSVGVTWWIEQALSWSGSIEEIHRRIRQGPPRFD
jgi:alkanesulfonate monooxygenase SsuD/methylene tetrahydromethanopterin reductase-like flavin-dependent oxidoreductase (luciferase family)